MSSDKEKILPLAPASPLANTVRLFVRVNRLHHGEIERRVSGLGIHHSQHRMLMTLANCDHTPSQRELADAMDISPAAVTTTLKCLEKEGYVARCMTDEDNRRNDVSITPRGREKIDESCAIFDSVDQTMFNGFTDEEIKTLDAFLRRMQDNLTCPAHLGKDPDGRD